MVELTNIEAERAILGSMLIDGDCVVDVARVLNPDDFYDNRHRWIYEVVLHLVSTGAAADFVTVTDELEKRRQLEEVGGAAYVMDLINAVPTAIHAMHYANLVEQYALARRVVIACGQIVQIAHDYDKDLCTKAVTIIHEATERKAAKDAVPLSAVLEQTVAQAKENARLAEEGEQASIPFGIPELDRRTGGMWPSNVIVVGGQPGSGKTALATALIHNAAKAGFRGALFSLEMTNTEIGERILAPESGYSTMEIRLGNVDFQTLDEAQARASTDNLFVDDSSALTIPDLVARIRRLHMRYGIQFVAIDYVQLVGAGKKTENRTQELSFISRSLKAIAKELRIPILIVAQLNRDYSKRQSKKPVMSDLEGSSQWEKEAEVIVFLYRDEEALVSESESSTVQVLVEKARSGQKGEFSINWIPRLAQFQVEPVTLPAKESAEYRQRLLERCGALSTTWSDWKTINWAGNQPQKFDLTVYSGLARTVVETLKQRAPLKQETVAELVATHGRSTAPATVALVEAATRTFVLQQAKEEIVPALLAGRFGIFTGPSGRGKTLMARIIQRALIAEHGVPAVWLNWRNFSREIKSTWGGNGREAEIWAQTNVPVLIVDDPDKHLTEWSIGYLYDLVDERMALTGGTQRAVLWALNNTILDFGKDLDTYGHLGIATAQRALIRSKPAVLDFNVVPAWERPGF